MDSKGKLGLSIVLPTLQIIDSCTKHCGDTSVASLNGQFSSAHLQVRPDDDSLFHGCADPQNSAKVSTNENARRRRFECNDSINNVGSQARVNFGGANQPKGSEERSRTC